MIYKEFYVETGTKELTDAVCKHGESLGYKQFYTRHEYNNNVFFYSDGDYIRHRSKHIEKKLSIKDFFKLTKEDVIMQDKQKVKPDLDLLHKLHNFFTMLLDGRIEIEKRGQGLCSLLNRYLLRPSEVFDEVIDVTGWDKFSGNQTYPIPLYNLDPKKVFEDHEDKWDKKHPYGRNRWEFIEWCHEQVKAQIEQANRDDMEFPVLAKSNTGMIVLFTDHKTGFNIKNPDNICHAWLSVTNNKMWTILKTAKELGLQVRNDK